MWQGSYSQTLSQTVITAKILCVLKPLPLIDFLHNPHWNNSVSYNSSMMPGHFVKHGEIYKNALGFEVK